MSGRGRARGQEREHTKPVVKPILGWADESTLESERCRDATIRIYIACWACSSSAGRSYRRTGAIAQQVALEGQFWSFRTWLQRESVLQSQIMMNVFCKYGGVGGSMDCCRNLRLEMTLFPERSFTSRVELQRTWWRTSLFASYGGMFWAPSFDFLDQGLRYSSQPLQIV